VSKSVSLKNYPPRQEKTIRIWICQWNPPKWWCTPTGLQYSTIEQKTTNWQIFCISSHIRLFLSFGSDFVRIFPSYCGLLLGDNLENVGLAQEIRRNKTSVFSGWIPPWSWSQQCSPKSRKPLIIWCRSPEEHSMDCHSLRTMSLQHIISSFLVNSISACYEHTTPTQDDQILLVTPYMNDRVNSNVHSYTTLVSVEFLWKMKCSAIITKCEYGDCNCYSIRLDRLLRRLRTLNANSYLGGGSER
jgi:hypothetical protein